MSVNCAIALEAVQSMTLLFSVDWGGSSASGAKTPGVCGAKVREVSATSPTKTILNNEVYKFRRRGTVTILTRFISNYFI